MLWTILLVQVGGCVFWSYSNSMEVRILGKIVHTKIVPIQLGSVLCVFLDENVQTWDICFMWTIGVPRPEPFECTLKIQDDACKNKITSLFRSQMQRERDLSPQDALISTSQWPILNGPFLCSRCYATEQSSDQERHLPFLREPL